MRSAIYLGNNWTGIPLVVWIGVVGFGWYYWTKDKDDEP